MCKHENELPREDDHRDTRNSFVHTYYYAKGLVVVKCFLSIIHRFYKKTYRSIA